MTRIVSISSELKEKYSGIKFGFLFVENLKIEKEDPEVTALRKQTEDEVKRYDYEHYLENKTIVSWNKQFETMGLNPNKVVPAQLAMIKRICKGKSIPNINVIVDLANIMACRSKLPVGAFNLNKISGNIVLRISKQGEKYLPLFETVEEAVPENEIVYADEEKIFSRYSKDCDITKVNQDTGSVFFVVDGTKDISSEEITQYLNELESLLCNILHAKITRKSVVE